MINFWDILFGNNYMHFQDFSNPVLASHINYTTIKYVNGMNKKTWRNFTFRLHYYRKCLRKKLVNKKVSTFCLFITKQINTPVVALVGDERGIMRINEYIYICFNHRGQYWIVQILVFVVSSTFVHNYFCGFHW